MSENANYQISPHLEQLSVSLSGSENVEVKAVLAIDTFIRRPIQMKMITDIAFSPISEEEMEKLPGIVGYVVKNGDNLWSLAKQYMTTIDGIREVNQLENDTIKPGEKLLIFKENAVPIFGEESR